MALSLECPACGARTRVEAGDVGGSVSCDRCGHALKVPAGATAGAPASVASGAGTPAPPPRRGGSVSSGAAVPPPRRRRREGTERLPADARSAERAAVSTAGRSGPVTVGSSPAATPPAARRGDGAGTGARPSRWWRLLAWIVALPIALVVVGLPARKAGYLTGQKLLDVIVEHDIGRFVPLLVIVALWALVTAVLVTLFIEGGHRLAARRAARRAGPA